MRFDKEYVKQYREITELTGSCCNSLSGTTRYLRLTKSKYVRIREIDEFFKVLFKNGMFNTFGFDSKGKYVSYKEICFEEALNYNNFVNYCNFFYPDHMEYLKTHKYTKQK